MAVTLERGNGYVDEIDHIYEALRLSTWLSWLRPYVNSNFHKPPNADILPVVALA